MPNILLGVTGSVASIKTKKLVEALKPLGEVRVVATDAARYFLTRDEPNCHLYVDEDEWPDDYKLGDSILHIELRRWADCLIIAPLDANTLAKISMGLCDNLLTSVVRAWDWQKPIFIAPAMNTAMWNNPPTDDQIKTIQRRGAYLISPIEKLLACNDVGIGAMENIDEIVKIVNDNLRWFFPLSCCSGIPINHHPGAFGFQRRKNHHTGVDLYTGNGQPVYAVESGTIVKIDQFTGSALGHTWWNDTWGMMVEGASGVVNYGEINCPDKALWMDGHYTIVKKVGDKVKRGEFIATVKQVLFDDKHRPDIEGHSCSMLHLELYKHGAREFAHWHDIAKEPNLLDPTPFLMLSESAPATITWNNSENKPVG